jgi:hypothetical protein
MRRAGACACCTPTAVPRRSASTASAVRHSAGTRERGRSAMRERAYEDARRHAPDRRRRAVSRTGRGSGLQRGDGGGRSPPPSGRTGCASARWQPPARPRGGGVGATRRCEPLRPGVAMRQRRRFISPVSSRARSCTRPRRRRSSRRGERCWSISRESTGARRAVDGLTFRWPVAGQAGRSSSVSRRSEVYEAWSRLRSSLEPQAQIGGACRLRTSDLVRALRFELGWRTRRAALPVEGRNGSGSASETSFSDVRGELLAPRPHSTRARRAAPQRSPTPATAPPQRWLRVLPRDLEERAARRAVGRERARLESPAPPRPRRRSRRAPEPSSAPPLPPGSRLAGRFVLGKCSARGARNSLRATDIGSGEQVAVKALQADRLTSRRQRLHGRRRWSRVNTRIWCGCSRRESEGVAYLTMELVEGEPLRSRMSIGRRCRSRGSRHCTA